MGVNNLSKIKKDKSVLIIIDCQNDFLIEGAPIECPGGRELYPSILKAREWAHKNNIPVIYTKEEHRKERIDFGQELERSEPIHCLAGSPGVEIVSELEPTESDYVMVKRRYSSFYLTDLEIMLRGLKRDTVIIAGVATNVCVYATALDAQQRDMQAVVLSDCVAGTSPDLHEAFLLNIDYVLGDVATIDEVMQALG